jgi:hypothetical protein
MNQPRAAIGSSRDALSFRPHTRVGATAGAALRESDVSVVLRLAASAPARSGSTSSKRAVVPMRQSMLVVCLDVQMAWGGWDPRSNLGVPTR